MCSPSQTSIGEVVQPSPCSHTRLIIVRCGKRQDMCDAHCLTGTGNPDTIYPKSYLQHNDALSCEAPSRCATACNSRRADNGTYMFAHGRYIADATPATSTVWVGTSFLQQGPSFFFTLYAFLFMSSFARRYTSMISESELNLFTMDRHRSNDPDKCNNSNRENRRREQKEDDSVPAKIGLSNPTACIDACFHQFVDEWSGKTHGSFEDVCNQLSLHSGPNTELWKLYCCDSTNCGVKTEQTGQSPSVDSIINRCQNTGNYFIYDPGPPSSNVFNCASAASGHGEDELQTISSAMTTTLSSSSSPAAMTSLSSKLNSTASDIGSMPSTPMGLTEGSKAAIGICSSLAIIAIIFLLGFLISRRRSHPKGFVDSASNAPRHVRSSSEPPSSSQTPLITPPPSASSKGFPLTPPARLSDRRFLPSLKQVDTPRSTFVNDGAFLPVALDSATEKKLGMLRHEPQTTPNNISKSPVSPSSLAAVHLATRFLRDSGSSYSSGPGRASTLTTASVKANSEHYRSAAVLGTDTPSQPPLSPTRPRRPRDGSLDIPHLVTPAGPPPTRALPAPPPYYPASPTFSVSPITPSSSPVPPSIRPLAFRDGTHDFRASRSGVVDHKGHMQSSARDFRDITEPYDRETSESWGSWGAGPGVEERKGAYGGYYRGRR
ncbi:hypothetical protein M434DRAFT_27999 [Hypoxylon sp. CO27-5]|nr:hypothetical protein M434DRAFT_27999 [Hypoxylon sp. CO27-5]